MKKILIIGVGAQGSTIAKRMNDEPNVSEIICADYDDKAAKELENTLEKARALQLDASKLENVIEAAQGVDLIVNGLPLEFGPNLIEAALTVKANYQDMAAFQYPDKEWVEGIKYMLTEVSEKFKAAGLTALMSTGSAPGLANVITKEAVSGLDSCENIWVCVYEGLWSKRFIPFWWSPQVAFNDMEDEAYCYENGEIVETRPFSRPMMVKYRGIENEIRMVEHAHDEPVTMGLLADQELKGAKNIYFKYGGGGIEFSEPLSKMGLLSREEIEVKGKKVAPMDIILKLAPPAPKYPDEIKAIIEEGLEKDEGAFLIRVEGVKDGKKVRIDSYVGAPSLEEAFEKSGLTHETYLTGQSASLFTKMFVNDKIKKKGMFPAEVFDAEERAYYLKEAAKLDITVDMYEESRFA
ncbi:MAG: saccharopine dehydrogenase NADP-binding domain-containing protein [Desulfobacterales bacterium]|nr:saccharopine dehydrogenase NADP-binding domain-containing protein [Desulfobacterales bacterium]